MRCVRPLTKTARIAGFWYLGFTLGPFYLLYVPAKTVVHNDAATAARILAHETLFRWGMLAETLGAVIFTGLALPRPSTNRPYESDLGVRSPPDPEPDFTCDASRKEQNAARAKAEGLKNSRRHEKRHAN